MCTHAFSVQVKTNAKTFNFWLVGAKAREMQSPSHVYVFVNLRTKKDGEVIEYYIVPSSVVAKKTKGTKWESFYREDALPFKDDWSIFLGDGK